MWHHDSESGGTPDELAMLNQWQLNSQDRTMLEIMQYPSFRLKKSELTEALPL